MRIGILFTGVANEFIGGAERFFADFYDIYHQQTIKNNQVYFITDKHSLHIFQKKLNKLIFLNYIILIPNFSNRFKNILESLFFLLKICINKLDIIHVGSYGRQYYHILNSIKFLPKFLRPKIIVNIVDCEIPYVLSDALNLKHHAYKLKYEPLFEFINIDAIYSWYQLFKTFAEEKKLIKSSPYIECIKTRFSDVKRFQPSKEKNNEIVYAARLTEQKRPMFFLNAILILKKYHFEDIKSWKFLIYGKGPLEDNIKQFVNDNQLQEFIIFDSKSDLSSVFAKTKCFVSTQDYENFPSLAMCEAMAAGNAIISRNVGQTNYFVKHSKNGYLLENDTPESLANAIINYINNSNQHLQMQNESIRLTTHVHTAGNFIKDIDLFWKKVEAL